MTDDQISALFHGAADTIDTSTSRFVDAAIAQGRRQRRTARLVTAGSATVLVAGLVTLAADLLPGSDGGPDTAPAGTGPGTSSAAPVAGTSAAPTTSTTSTTSAPAAAAATVAMTPQALLQTLLDQLPASVRTSHYAGNFAGGAAPKSSGFAGAQLQVDDGRGAAAVMIALFDSAADNGLEPCTAREPDCAVLSDGTTVQVEKGHQYTDGRPGPIPAEWTVTVVQPDGSALDFFEYNAPAPKDAAVDRAAPPFSTATVTRWLMSPAYSATITKARAEHAAHLFRPIEVTTLGPTGSASADKTQQRTNCTLAQALHKTPPSYC